MNAPATFNAPAPALIVIGGGSPAPASHERAARAADPSLQRLLAALPAASQVLELGCDQGELAQAYQRRHPQAQWLALNPHTTAPPVDNGTFDLIVVNRLEHLPTPPRRWPSWPPCWPPVASCSCWPRTMPACPPSRT